MIICCIAACTEYFNQSVGSVSFFKNFVDPPIIILIVIFIIFFFNYFFIICINTIQDLEYTRRGGGKKKIWRTVLLSLCFDLSLSFTNLIPCLPATVLMSSTHFFEVSLCFLLSPLVLILGFFESICCHCIWLCGLPSKTLSSLPPPRCPWLSFYILSRCF